MAASVASLTRPCQEVADDKHRPGRPVRGQGGQDADLVSVGRLFQVQVRDVQEPQHGARGGPRRWQGRVGHDGRLAASCSAAGPTA